MKLVLVINSLHTGGAERVMAKLADRWNAAGHAVVLVTLAPHAQDEYPTDRAVERVSLEAGGLSNNLVHAAWKNVVRWRRLRRLIRAEKPDRIVAFMTVANVLSILAAAGSRVPVICSERLHPAHLDIPPTRKLAQRLTYRHARTVVCLSRPSADWLEQRTGCRTAVIPNSIALPLARLEPAVDPDDHVPQGACVVLSVGRLVDQKQMDHVLRAFAHSPDEDRWLVIIGSGPDAGRLDSLARELEVADRCVRLDRVGNVEDWYRRADVFVLASKYEGFPNALLEALACGTPAVAYDCETGPGELVVDGENGCLVPVNDQVSLAAALARVLSDAELRARMAGNARAVATRFSDARCLAEWDAVVLEGNSDRRSTRAGD